MNHSMPDDPLFRWLHPERPTAIVDIGANPVDGDPPYKKMLDAGLCTLVGFEPQPEALAELQGSRGAAETYLPDAVGDGLEHTLYICRASGMTSCYRPDQRHLAVFDGFTEFGQVIARQPINTRKLDDVAAIQALDYLKIDIQGSELSVFQSGRAKLGKAVAIQTEVSFLPLYEGQPLFWEVDRELREQGFIPHAFDAVKRWPIAPYRHLQAARQPLNQLLEADLVYVRDFTRADEMDDEQLKQLALVSHHCYGSHDLALRCLDLLVRRSALGREALDGYCDLIGAARLPGSKQGPGGDLSDFSFSVSFSQ